MKQTIRTAAKAETDIVRLGRIAPAAVVLLVVFLAGTAFGQATVAQNLAMTVARSVALNADGTPDRLMFDLDGLSASSGPSAARDERFIQYSLITAKDEHLSLTARLEDPDSLPSGLSVQILAVPSGKRHEGESLGTVILSDRPQAILTGLGSCATGTGPSDGTRLVITLAASGAARSAAPVRPEQSVPRSVSIILSFE
jgi:hypothetical protein